MKGRLVVAIVGLTISFAFPTYAQQKDVADPQTTKKILAIGKAIDEGINNNNPAAIAANYTRDAVIVTDRGANNWSASHSEIDRDLYEWLHPKNHITKVDGNADHLIGTAGNELWATGEWSETGQGKNGEPIPIKGYWAAIVVREGDDWKIRVA